MRTDQKLDEICEKLRQNCGDLFDAARSSGVSLDFLERWCKDDPEAAEKLTEARRIGYMRLESVLIDRAVNGTQKQVFYKGEVVGYETEYHNTLLLKALEARVPEYGKKGEGGGVNVNVQIANVMPRANSFDEWLDMKNRTLQDRAVDALPKPMADNKPLVPEILQGTYVVKEEPLRKLEGLL